MTCGMESPRIRAFVNVRRSHSSRLEGHFTIFIHLFQIKTIFDSKAFCVDSSGSFCPRDATYNPAGKLNPTAILNLLFPKGQSKNPTTIPHSVEEGLLDMLAARAADQDIGEGAYDTPLSFHTAAAMFASQSPRLIAYHAIRGSAQAALRSLVRFSRFH